MSYLQSESQEMCHVGGEVTPLSPQETNSYGFFKIGKDQI